MATGRPGQAIDTWSHVSFVFQAPNRFGIFPALAVVVNLHAVSHRTAKRKKEENAIKTEKREKRKKKKKSERKREMKFRTVNEDDDRPRLLSLPKLPSCLIATHIAVNALVFFFNFYLFFGQWYVTNMWSINICLAPH